MVTPSECPHVIKLESDFISTSTSLGARLCSKKNCREPSALNLCNPGCLVLWFTKIPGCPRAKVRLQGPPGSARDNSTVLAPSCSKVG